MVDGIKGVVVLLTQAIQGVFIDNEIGAFWLALVVILIVTIFIFYKLTNRDG